MKRFNKIIIAGSLLVATFGTGCEKHWFDVNKDPNNAVESNITPDLIAPNALLNSANRTATSYSFLGNWLGFWCPAANYAPNVEEQSYNITTNFAAGIFNGLLDNAYDYQFMEKRATESNQLFYRGIAKIMKSHNFAQLVDCYDKAPYFEALQGLQNIRPKYDDGLTIYEDLIKQIDTAISNIKAADPGVNLNISANDVLFHGDKTMWVKFANTLKLRLLMHQANRADRASYINTEIGKILAEGSGFLGSGEDASLTPGTSAGNGFTQDKPNAFYASYGFNTTGAQATDFWRANVIGLNFLKNNNDPRLGAFYKPIVGTVPVGAPEPFTQPSPTTYRGNQYGLSINNVTYPYQTFNFVSQVGGIAVTDGVKPTAVGLLKGYNQPIWLMTSVESLFLQAEAVERGWLAGDKETAYKNAVLESFKWLNIGGSAAAATTAFNTFYSDQSTNTNVNYAIAPNKLNVIMFQKYLAQNGTNFLEVWTDYRRYGGYPVIPLSVNPGRTSPILPNRLLYPQGEINLNTANVPTLGRNSGDQFTGKIWWQP